MHIQKDILLSPYTTFGIGGTADEFVVAHSTQDVVDAILYAHTRQMPFFLLGRGANILIGDMGFRGLVIKNEAKGYGIESNFLTAESGAMIGDLMTRTVEKGLSGLEHFAGIPSTLGGALWQNLHFLSPDRQQTMFIGDIVEKAVIYSGGARKTVDRSYFQFGYDYSSLHKSRDIVLSVVLRLIQEDPFIIQQRMTSNLEWRREKHPFEAWKHSAGSVFRKIEGHGAGRLIEQVGLKGYSIGGAQISQKHANFIVNNGQASAKDVRDLILLVQEKVKKELNFDMVPEISFIGEFI